MTHIKQFYCYELIPIFSVF